eukprot:10717-Eustigmatos_ZCMA.PRE.1
MRIRTLLRLHTSGYRPPHARGALNRRLYRRRSDGHRAIFQPHKLHVEWCEGGERGELDVVGLAW